MIEVFQQTFETVARHLFAQGERSMRLAPDQETCAYRGTGDRKCAIGALIPDAHYNTGMEYCTVFGLEPHWVQMPEWMRGGCGSILAKRLQEAHDQAGNWGSTETMRAKLRAIADEYNLDAAFLDTLSFKDR